MRCCKRVWKNVKIKEIGEIEERNSKLEMRRPGPSLHRPRLGREFGHPGSLCKSGKQRTYGLRRMEGAVRVANKGLAEACFCERREADFVRVARKGLSEGAELKIEGTKLNARGRSCEIRADFMGNDTTHAVDCQ